MRLLIVIVTFLWLCCGIGYSIYEPKMASFAIFVTGLIAFLTALANNRQKTQKENATQSQIVKGNGTGIQVGGNLTIKEKDK